MLYEVITDLPTTYMSREEVEAEEANDPLLHSVRLLDRAGALAPDEALAIYSETLETVTKLAEKAVTRPRLSTATEVMRSRITSYNVCYTKLLRARPDQRRGGRFGDGRSLALGHA